MVASLFQSTPSGRKATLHGSVTYAGGTFQSTPSGRKATGGGSAIIWRALFQSTPSGRKATDITGNGTPDMIVSIHAFREEGDLFRL